MPPIHLKRLAEVRFSLGDVGGRAYAGGMSSQSTGCSIEVAPGERCRGPVEPASPLNLCAHHLAVAHDWVARDVGVTDVLPSACIACGSRLGVRYPSGWLCAICEWKVGDLADHEVAGVRVDVVYYIRFDTRIKIGTSSNPRSRLTTLKHNELLAFERGGRQVEQRRHKQFAEFRLARTEWFEISDPLSAHIDILRRGIDNPWELYKLWVSQQLALQG
jgi:hypothetical protein